MTTETSKAVEDDKLVPLAVVGMAFEFPQEATSVESFWEIIREGRSTSSEFPPDHLNIDAFYHPDGNRPSTLPLRGGHFVKEALGTFDAPFFSITPGEAACMDPQHRRMLEIAYHAIEDAGIPVEKCTGSDTSVYTGCFTNDYLSILQQDYDAEQRHAAMGISPAMLANRISWFFNFKGTSMNLDSACSSSLIALHLACQELRLGNSSMALVGGANLVYHPNFMKIMSDFNFLSSDSRCWSFDERANGYARGEGIAMVVVKRLDDALRDGNTIRAVIRNTGSNQDGKTQSITQPSQVAQINLITRTYQQAHIDMEPTRFFEAHATGTAVGDPIEGNAIGEAFKEYRSSHDPLYIGAIKANIGHLEGCSGLAGIIKTILVLEHGVIPPIAGFKTLNKRIDSKRLHLEFPTDPIAWPLVDIRRACVNSFGLGGTNAVAILDDAYNYLRLRGLRGDHRTHLSKLPYNGEDIASNARGVSSGMPGLIFNDVAVNGYDRDREEIPATIKPSTLRRDTLRNGNILDNLGMIIPKLLIWSAPDRQGVERLSRTYHEYLVKDTIELDDVAYNLVVRRSHFPWRSFAVIDPEKSISSKEIESPEPIKGSINNPQITFVFTGQGSQYLGMGRQLLAYPVYRDSLENCAEYLKQIGCQWSLLDTVNCGKDGIPVDSPDYSQPLITCLQIALVDLLQSLGVIPKIVMGHSSGEIAAAYSSGALSKSSAVKVAYYRGQLSSHLVARVQGLGMMAVGMAKHDVQQYIDRLAGIDGRSDVEIGCINSPKNITLTGNAKQLAVLEEWLKADGFFARALPIPMAYHSHFMNGIKSEYTHAIKDLDAGQSSGHVPMISSVSGDLATATELISAEYWVRNLTSPVNFEAAFSKLLTMINRKPRKRLGERTALDYTDVTHVLEIGPHHALRSSIRENIQAFIGVRKPAYISSLIRGEDAVISLLKMAGGLYCAGYPVDLLSVNGLEECPRPLTPGLPRYTFNHSQIYWRESSLSRNFRFRGAPRHELLGSRSLDWNPDIAQWRNIIRLDELPWLEDHKIGGMIVFPAAGMIAMAIEGLRQLIDPLHGIHVKNVNFLHAISLPQEVASIETQLTISRPLQGTSTIWSTFRLFVQENGSYIECCNGKIRAVLDAEDRSRVISSGPWKRNGMPSDWARNIKMACGGAEVDPYKMPAGIEVQYGPTFQNLRHLRLGSLGEVTAEVDTESWKSKNISSTAPSFAVHPTTLNALAQPLLLALLAQRRGDLPTMVPVHVSTIWIDCYTEGLHRGNIAVAARCKFSGYRGGYADVLASAMDESNPLIYMEGLETSFISVGSSSQSQAIQPRRLCARLIWKPDHDMMTPEQILAYCTRDRPKQDDDAVKSYRSLILAILCFIEETLAKVSQDKNLVLERHLDSYIDWMRHQQRRLHTGKSLVTYESVLQLLDDREARDQLNQQIENSGIDGFFFIQIGRQVIQMLHGQIDPLDFMFREGLANKYYEKMLSNHHHAYPASRYVDLLCFKNARMNILEVGAGTGGQTMCILESMSSNGVNKWAKYDYTDISPGFFNQAREKFHYPNMNFRICDISKDPISQSFEPGSYDLVIASHVLHATNKLAESIQNIRKLLKPGGKLLLFETTRPDAIPVGFAFGLLKGWWDPLDYEPRSPYSPCLTVEQWDMLLKQGGFSGVDLNIPGQEEPYCRDSSILISTAESQNDEINQPLCEVNLVVNNHVEAQSLIATALETGLSKSEHLLWKRCSLAQLAKANIPESSLTIFLEEIDATFLEDISEIDYASFQAILVRSKTVLWVTKALPPGRIEPRHHLAHGLGRTLMSEDSDYKFVTLCLEDFEYDVTQVTETIYKIVGYLRNLPVEKVETNYVATHNTLQICRISENVEMDTIVQQANLPWQLKECQLTVNTSIQLCKGELGRLDSIQWLESEEQDASRKQPLDDDEVMVQVRAIGLTFRDYLIVNGQLNEADIGTECAGLVIEAGSKSGFQTGDRVCLISTASARSIIRGKAGAIVAIPSHMNFAEAASLPTAMWVSYQAIVNLANLQRGQTVLIHQGASCVGQMMIQTAKRLGARVLVTTSSMFGRKFIYDEFQIPEADIFCASDATIVLEINRCTQGQGVDAIVGALSANGAGETVDFIPCLSPSGRLVDTSSLNRSSGIAMPLNTSRSLVNMISLLQERPTLAHDIFQRAMKKAFDERLRPPQPIRTFSAADAGKAFHQFQVLDAPGKNIIEINSDTIVMADVKTIPRCKLYPDATYVISGGLGGLGRSITRWMVDRGARNLILLSRSGVKSQEAKNLIRYLEGRQICVVTPAVDISNLVALKHVLKPLEKTMPPIRGCIQATVALRDNLFPNMTYCDWIVGTNSKAKGSWNLHSVLPCGLDFFVLFASLNGILGGRAQANYAAGNTFKDALAHYRISLGEKAISIDLGLMASEGIVAENADLLASMRRIGHLMDINQEELIALLDYYCDSALPILSHDKAQILVGLETPGAIRAKGIDIHHAIHRPLFQQLFSLDSGSLQSPGQQTTISYAMVLKEATSREEASAMVTGWLQAKIAHTLGLQEEDVDPTKPIHTYGIDSLVAIDLKNWFSKEIGADIKVFFMLGNQTLEAVAREAVKGSKFMVQ